MDLRTYIGDMVSKVFLMARQRAGIRIKEIKSSQSELFKVLSSASEDIFSYHNWWCTGGIWIAFQASTGQQGSKYYSMQTTQQTIIRFKISIVPSLQGGGGARL